MVRKVVWITLAVSSVLIVFFMSVLTYYPTLGEGIRWVPLWSFGLAVSASAQGSAVTYLLCTAPKSESKPNPFAFFKRG